MTQRFPSIPLSEQDVRLGNGTTSSGSSTGMAGLGSPAADRWGDDSGHGQRMPGAYEWWYFDALDHNGNGVVLLFCDGIFFHPLYMGQSVRWGRRATRSPFEFSRSAADPAHYPGVFCGVYQNHRRIAQFLNMFPPRSFQANTETPEFRVGPNRVTIRADGSFGVVVRGYPYEFTHGRPQPRLNQVITAELSFSPAFGSVQHVRPFRPQGPDGATHNWVVAAPLCQVTGRVQRLAEPQSDVLLDMPIEAQGYHDHAFGQGSLAMGMKRQSWGRALGPGWTAAWQQVQPSKELKNPLRVDGLMLFESPRGPMVIESPTIRNDHFRTTRFLLRYPARTTMHGSDAHGNSVELVLRNQSVVESSPFHARLAGEISLMVLGKRQYAGPSLTTIVELHRLHWPLFSDLVLMSMLPVAADDPLWQE